MPNRDFYFRIILLVAVVSGISASCQRSISCPCGTEGKLLYYKQCINNALDEESACENWANCNTCDANTTYCLTCPPGRSGLICTEDCGRTNRRLASAVRKAETSQAARFPWIVRIYVNETGVNCAGVLLDHTTVLSAANCLVDAEYFTLFFGIDRINSKNGGRYVKTRRSNQIIIHPEFNWSTFDNDIAIVKFSPDVSYSVRIQPICMPTPDSSTENLVLGQTGYAIGWWLGKDQIMSSKLIVAPTPIQTAETCVTAYQRRGIRTSISKGMFCGGFADRSNIICKGASGAPLVFYDVEADRFTLEGLISHGTAGN